MTHPIAPFHRRSHAGGSLGWLALRFVAKVDSRLRGNDEGGARE